MSSQSLKTDSLAALACNSIKKVEPVHISCLLEYLASHKRNEQKKSSSTAKPVPEKECKSWKPSDFELDFKADSLGDFPKLPKSSYKLDKFSRIVVALFSLPSTYT